MVKVESETSEPVLSVVEGLRMICSKGQIVKCTNVLWSDLAINTFAVSVSRRQISLWNQACRLGGISPRFQDLTSHEWKSLLD